MRETQEDSRGVIGAPRKHENLLHEGEAVSLNRVARRNMRDFGRVASGCPAGVKNLLERDFTAHKPERKWATDITEIATLEGISYAWYSTCIAKLVVGWSMHHRQVMIRAMEVAIWQRRGDWSVILHSDHGSQFTSADYQRFLNRNTLVCCMNAVGHCGEWPEGPSSFNSNGGAAHQLGLARD